MATALKICLFPGLPALFYVRIVYVRAGMICIDDTRASRLQAKGRRWYLSQNIGPAVAESAGPAPPPPVEETSQLVNANREPSRNESRDLAFHHSRKEAGTFTLD